MIYHAGYYTWYSVTGVVFACFVVYAYTLAKAWRIRRRVSAARKTGRATTSTGAASALSRFISATHAVLANTAYVRVIPAYFFGRSTAAEWWWTAAYTGISLGVGFWGCIWQGKLDYANPMGVVAFYQIPLVVGLASRNNVISFVTGIGYEKLNYLHRAAGRVCILTTWLHTLGWFHKGLGKHGPGTEIFLTGMLGSVACLIMWLTSFQLCRHWFYEAFLVAHILMGIIFIACAYLHWPRMGEWCWVGLFLWGLDRFCGWARMFIVNKAWLLPFKSKRDQHSACVAELLLGDVVRLTVNRPLFRWFAGQHALITMPQVATLRYEQHPVTVANVPDESGDVVFIIKAQTGFTRRLVKHLTDAVDTSLNCYLEGPYGSPASLNHYDTVLLVSGGTGVTHSLSHLLSIMKASRQGTSAVSTVRLVWNVRDAAHISWIAPLLNEATAAGTGALDIAIDMYVTRGPESLEPGDPVEVEVDTEGDGSGSTTPTDSVHDVANEKVLRRSNEKLATATGLSILAARVVSFHKGRSPIDSILRADVNDSICIAAGVAVSVCGPTALMHDCRRAVVAVNSASKVFAGQAPIEFHSETFGW